MSNIELKACPFCGEGADYLIVDHLEGTVMRPAFCIRCDYCGASCRHTDRGDHVSIWNTRAPQWQPIETAPKDGTAVLATSAHMKGPNGEPVAWAAVFDQERERLVATWDGEPLYDATHWQPLPAPPEVEG